MDGGLDGPQTSVRVAVIHEVGGPRSAPGRRIPGAFVWLAAFAIGLVLWAAASGRVAPQFLLPTPASVAQAMFTHRARLAEHAAVTLGEVAGGFLLGMSAACVLGYVMYRSRTFDQVATPFVVASQAVPAVVFAPMLVYWLGSGPSVKVLVAALIVFFPMLVATVTGFRQIQPELHDLMRSYATNPVDTLVKLEIPAALPTLFTGLKVAVTLAVIGAAVGEFVGAERGLAVAIQIARAQYNAPLMAAATLCLTALGLLLYGAMSILEHRLLANRGPRYL
jgi:NitT/TauT family transport system permease protein